MLLPNVIQLSRRGGARTKSHKVIQAVKHQSWNMSRMLSILRHFSVTQVGRLDNLTLPTKEPHSKGSVRFFSRYLIIVPSVISTIFYSCIIRLG